jgi:tripartite-type tricarboxylate transporter receptor subunit TctC
MSQRNRFKARRQFLTQACAAGAALSPLGAMAQASAWPSKTLRLLVGFPPGSSPDLMARTLAEPLSKVLGQSVIVENRPGASGNIAADAMLKSNDEHSFLLATGATLTTAKLLYKKLPFDPADLYGLTLVGTSPLVLAAPAKLVTGTPTEFMKAALASGDKWNYGSPGNGLTGHLGVELLKMKTGLKPVHVPFPGTPQIFAAMATGDIQLALLPLGPAVAQIRAGRLKPIGITTPGRSVLAPELAPLSEAGVAGMNLQVWNAIAVPKSMPKANAAKLLAALQLVIRSDEVRQKLYVQGWQAQGTSPEALANLVKNDTAELGAVIKAGNIQLD